jgi:hypothetical protein
VKDSHENAPWVMMTIVSGSEELEMMSRTMTRVEDTALVACMKLDKTILEG